MASIINATTTAGVSVQGDNSGSLQLATNNGTTAVTIDTSQNVGIGTASPTGKFEVKSANNTGTDPIIRATSNNGTASTWLTFNGVSVSSGNTCVFYNGTTEHMRIDSSGNLLVGTTSNIAKIGAVFDGNTNNGCVLRTSTNANAAGFLYFQQDTNTCGSVVRVGTTSAVTYSTTSDYRLKENVLPMTDGLDKVSRLKPVTYTWKQGGESAEGFIAHELAEVCPDAVVGTKDQVETYLDDDGIEKTRPKYQSIDTSFLVATLTAAIQELKAELDATKAEVQALKGTL